MGFGEGPCREFASVFPAAAAGKAGVPYQNKMVKIGSKRSVLLIPSAFSQEATASPEEAKPAASKPNNESEETPDERPAPVLSAAAADRLVEAAWKKPAVEREWLANREREKGNELFKVRSEGAKGCIHFVAWSQGITIGKRKSASDGHHREQSALWCFVVCNQARSYDRCPVAETVCHQNFYSSAFAKGDAMF